MVKVYIFFLHLVRIKTEKQIEMEQAEVITRLRNQLKPKLPTLEEISKTLEYKLFEDKDDRSYIEATVVSNGKVYLATDIYDMKLYNILEGYIEDTDLTYYENPRVYLAEFVLTQNRVRDYQ